MVTYQKNGEVGHKKGNTFMLFIVILCMSNFRYIDFMRVSCLSVFMVFLMFSTTFRKRPQKGFDFGSERLETAPHDI